MASKPAAAARKKSQVHALHIGLTEVVAAGEFDARDVAAIARQRSMNSTPLLTRKAERAKGLAAIRRSAQALSAGDLLRMSGSGHGGQGPDVTGEAADKPDGTWCLHDGQLTDDALCVELGHFRAGVRMRVTSDRRHSGTAVRAGRPQPGGPEQRPRLMPAAGCRRQTPFTA